MQSPPSPSTPTLAPTLWYAQTWFTILMLVLFAPIGWFLMWKYRNWSTGIKVAATVFSLMFFLYARYDAAQQEAQRKAALERKEASVAAISPVGNGSHSAPPVSQAQPQKAKALVREAQIRAKKAEARALKAERQLQENQRRQAQAERAESPVTESLPDVAPAQPWPDQPVQEPESRTSPASDYVTDKQANASFRDEVIDSLEGRIEHQRKVIAFYRKLTSDLVEKEGPAYASTYDDEITKSEVEIDDLKRQIEEYRKQKAWESSRNR